MVIDKYASARAYFGTTKPAGMPQDDQDRIQAYDLYDNFYWNVPAAYKLVSRSEDVSPIYLPSARNMIEATWRFLAVKWRAMVDPTVGTTGDQQIIRDYFKDLFKRENMYVKFSSNKRHGLIRGDALWHITANPDKPEGQRISIHTLHPGQYFPILDEDDPDKVVGCHIVDEVEDPTDDTKTVSRRQTYRKDQVTNVVTSSLMLFELNKWDDRDDPEDAVLIPGGVKVPPTPLPEQITQIPVYHIQNYRENDPWGSSQIRGIETVFAAASQAISDQDLALSLQGLGVYWTDSGPPKGASGEDAPFVMGPGEVVEVAPGTSFGRVSGISGALPGIEHIDYILGSAHEAVGVPDIARGKADVQVAESGIALAIQMGPLLAQNEEKESEILGVMDQMFYDLVQMWMPAYERTPAGLKVDVTNIVGDPMPINRETTIAELTALLAANLITAEMVQGKLADLGYEFPEGAEQELKTAREQAATLAADPFGDRLNQENANEEVPVAE